MSNIISSIREAVCDNQGAYTRYSHKAHELHKELRIAHDRGESLDVLVERLVSLAMFLEEGLESTLQYNFNLLSAMFRLMSPQAPHPRICAKSNIRLGGTNLVFDLSRYFPSSDVLTPQVTRYINDPYPVGDNTGFLHVAETGKYFFEGDIPQAVLSGYKNPRLDPAKAEAYARSFPRPEAISSSPAPPDPAWENCWKGYGKTEEGIVSPESCYKSTMIVPIRLSSQQLGEEILGKIKRIFPEADDIRSLLFAYLCFDHVEAHYFDEKVHVELAYVFADLLSLYFCTRWTLTVASKTYRDVCGMIAETQDATEGET